MKNFKFFACRLRKDEEGATAIEYGLLAALISVAIIATVTTLGGTLDDVFTGINDDLTAEAPAEPPAGG